MKVLVTGATGLIGKEIVKNLHDRGIVVHYLSTSPEKVKTKTNTKGFYWNPETGEVDETCLNGVEVIIHLAGASIAHRWTSKYKEEIVESRVLSSNLLFQLLKTHPNQVRQLISASAIGIYPSSLERIYQEDFTAIEDTFLSNVVVKWEESVEQFTRLGIKVCKLRIGLVLSKKGGAFPQLLKPIRWGMGSVFGSGKQWQSWIHIKDLARMFVFALEHELDGVYNAVAPQPVTHRDLLFSIARILQKPLFVPNTPKWVLKLILGEMHVLLFDSQKVQATKIREKGFYFKYTQLEEALRNLLKKD